MHNLEASDLHLLILSLRAQNNGAEIVVTVALESGNNRELRAFTLTAEQYCELKLRKGEIDELLFDRIETAARNFSAVKCGEKLLSYAPASVLQLTRKIMRHGFTQEEANQAALSLETRGLILEENDMKREVEKCLKKFWGARRIRSFLWSKGFSEETLSGLQSLLADVDFSRLCADCISKHYGDLPTEAHEKTRMIASLSRYGFSPEEIRQGMRLANLYSETNK